MAGSPSQLDLFDYKPELVKYNGKPCPDELLKGKRFAFIKGVPKMLGTPFKFARHGQSGHGGQRALPHLPGVDRRLAVIKSMHTDQFNHAPAELFLYTGSPQSAARRWARGSPTGSGTENQDLPGFVVLTSGGKTPDARQERLGQRLPAHRLPGRPVPIAGRPGPLPVATPGAWTAPAGARPRRPEPAQRLAGRGDRRPRDPDADRQYELAFRMQIAAPR